MKEFSCCIVAGKYRVFFSSEWYMCVYPNTSTVSSFYSHHKGAKAKSSSLPVNLEPAGMAQPMEQNNWHSHSTRWFLLIDHHNIYRMLNNRFPLTFSLCQKCHVWLSTMFYWPLKRSEEEDKEVEGEQLERALGESYFKSKQDKVFPSVWLAF